MTFSGQGYLIKETNWFVLPSLRNLKMQSAGTIPLLAIGEREGQIQSMLRNAYLNGIQWGISFASCFLKHCSWLTTAHDGLIKSPIEANPKLLIRLKVGGSWIVENSWFFTCSWKETIHGFTIYRSSS